MGLGVTGFQRRWLGGRNFFSQKSNVKSDFVGDTEFANKLPISPLFGYGKLPLVKLPVLQAKLLELAKPMPPVETVAVAQQPPVVPPPVNPTGFVVPQMIQVG